MNNTKDLLLNLKAYIKNNDKVYIDMLLDNLKSELLHNKHHLEYELKDINNNLELIDLIEKESD